MKRISSCLTIPQKIIGIALALGFFVGAYVFHSVSIIPSSLFFFAGLAVAGVWWKYVFPAAKVFMKDHNLYVKRHARLVKIPFDRVIELRKPAFVKNPPLIISYENESGTRTFVIFMPSIRENGWLFGETKLEKPLKGRISRR